MRHFQRQVVATWGAFGRRAWRAAALVAAMASLSLPPLAWDVERMAQAAQRMGPQALQGVRALQPLLQNLTESDDGVRLDTVNHFFNGRIVFRDDLQVWHTEDYWASPLETLQQGAGDCEDFAIAK